MKSQRWIHAALLAAALGMILLGALQGGHRELLAKAVRVCSECIGLG